MLNFRKIENFIVFEGLDGAGTTTQSNILEKKFHENNVECINSSEPTNGRTGKVIREILSGDVKFHPGTLARLFSADRHEHIYGDSGILKECHIGKKVISDRYLFSSLAYQSLGYGFDNVRELNAGFPLPEYLFFLEVPAQVCQDRLSRRDKKEIFEDYAIQEKILLFYRKGIDLYRDSGMNIHILDGTLPPGELGNLIWSILNQVPINKV